MFTVLKANLRAVNKIIGEITLPEIHGMRNEGRTPCAVRDLYLSSVSARQRRQGCRYGKRETEPWERPGDSGAIPRFSFNVDIFWDDIVQSDINLGGTYCLTLQNRGVTQAINQKTGDPEERGRKCARNVSKFLSDYKAPHPPPQNVTLQLRI
jgi:hypothetical protein